MSTDIAMAINQNDPTTVVNPPVPDEPNPALPPGEPIDSDDEVELIDYNESVGISNIMSSIDIFVIASGEAK